MPLSAATPLNAPPRAALPAMPPRTPPRHALPDAKLPRPPLVVAGETCSRTLRLSREDIAAFARLSGDSNPLHHDAIAAQRAHHGEIIASGQHSTALLIGLASSYFSRPGDGFGRELLCLNFNFAFKAPVFADQLLALSWQVASVEWHATLGGLLAQVDGRAAVRDSHPAVVSRATLLVKTAPA